MTFAADLKQPNKEHDMTNASRVTAEEVAAKHPNTAQAMTEAGFVAEVVYEGTCRFSGKTAVYSKHERADGTFTKPQRVA